MLTTFLQVPSAENSEIVKALAKQVVAYCLRNMERLALDGATAEATDRLTKPLGGEDPRDVAIPDVLRHLVGHAGVYEHHDHDGSSPDSDYIVGGTGVVKALQAVLGEQALELRRGSYPNAGTVTPQERAEEAGRERERKGKAKEMSKSLLDSARNIRARLQPSLVKEATAGDEMAYSKRTTLRPKTNTNVTCRTTAFPGPDIARHDSEIRRRIPRDACLDALTEAARIPILVCRLDQRPPGQLILQLGRSTYQRDVGTIARL